MDRQKFMAGTSAKRGSPQYNESNASSQRRSTVWRTGTKVPAVSPPNPLKAASRTSGFFFLNAINASRKASQFFRNISSLVNFRAASGVAMVKLAKSNLNNRTPRSYQNCMVSMNCGRKPPSKKHIADPVASMDDCHSGMTSRRKGTLEATHKPGLMLFVRHAWSQPSGPLGQFGFRKSRYPPLVAYQNASIR